MDEDEDEVDEGDVLPLAEREIEAIETRARRRRRRFRPSCPSRRCVEVRAGGEILL